MLTTAAEAGCTSDYVTCTNGYTDPPSNTITCATACGPSCCIDEDACKYFTGKVCKDGSCNGDFSCYEAHIDFVVNSCKGDESCANVGDDGGTVGIIVNSCSYGAACEYLGYAGTVGYVKDSCNEYKACAKLGYIGTVGNIKGSCNGYEACKNVAGMSGGSTGYLTSSCNGKRACTNLGYYGTAGNVKDSCNSDYSCKGVAFDIGGSIGDILSSCNNESACKNAGYDVNSDIFSSLNNCCSTTVSECEGASEATLPAQCKGAVSDYVCWLEITLPVHCCWCCYGLAGDSSQISCLLLCTTYRSPPSDTLILTDPTTNPGT
jgi:hypothetical protein